MTSQLRAGALVTARGRDWVVLPESDDDLLVLRPLGGADDDIAAVFLGGERVEAVTQSSLDPPSERTSATSPRRRLLRTALRIGFRSSAGPFRSLAAIAVEPRAYQLVPLLMALKQHTVRLAISDDVGHRQDHRGRPHRRRAARPGQRHRPRRPLRARRSPSSGRRSSGRSSASTPN